MRILCVCNQGRHRSRTAAELLSAKHETCYRGIYGNLVSKEDIAWADLVLVMEDAQRKEIARLFPTEYLRKRILNLNVPDIYSYGQPELIATLQDRFAALPATMISSGASQKSSIDRRASPRSKAPAPVV
jgi:predicted protein tyrosine phosphatase